MHYFGFTMWPRSLLEVNVLYLLNEAFQVKITITISYPRCVDFVGIHIVGLRCSWWHSRQANDAIYSKGSIFSENQDYRSRGVFRGGGGGICPP